MNKCRTIDVVHLAGKKWTFVLMQEIALNGDKGFNYILKRMDRISPKLLSKRLKDLGGADIIKKNISNKPAKSSYNLTEKGKELYEVLMKFKDWHERFFDQQEGCKNKNCADCSFYNE